MTRESKMPAPEIDPQQVAAGAGGAIRDDSGRRIDSEPEGGGLGWRDGALGGEVGMMVKKTMPVAVRGELLRSRIEEFGEELVALMSREEHLHSAEELRRNPELMAETADRMRLQHEQLLVADEELRAQMFELDEVTQRLAVERKRSQELFQFAPDPMFYTDRSGSVRDANPSACKMLGLEHRFIMGKPLVTFVERGDVTRFRELTDRIANVGPTEVKLLMQARSGATEEVLLRGQVFEERHHVVWAARRIDERFTVNERISLPPSSVARESGERLVAANGDRTDELTAELRRRDEQLDSERRRSGQLEAASEAKDRSLAMVSHELRGPINVVLGWTNLLRSGDLDEAQRERALLVIERNARAQAALVEDLMDVSRIVARTLALTMEKLDFSTVVMLTAEAIDLEAKARGIALTANIAADVQIYGDRARITQVLMNLISNALKFTQKGGRIDIDLAKVGQIIVLEVRDTGAGIAPDDLPHVFNCFHQAEDKRTRSLGMGLGLFLVKELVELHGGSTSARSDGVGHGARVRVTLPAARDLAD